MTTKESLWETFCEANSAFRAAATTDAESTQITLTARGLRKLFDLTYDHAHEAGERSGRALEKADQVRKPKGQMATNFLDSFFGNTGRAVKPSTTDDTLGGLH